MYTEKRGSYTIPTELEEDYSSINCVPQLTKKGGGGV
jgi:hypothetical protein